MSETLLKHGIGIFSTHYNAKQALNELKDTHFPVNKVSIVANTADDPEDDLNNDNRKPSTITRIEGAVAGLVMGGAIGGLLATAAGLGILLIPGVGAALAVESVLAALVKGGGIATISGLIGALKGWSISDAQSRFYRDRFVQGDYLVVIEATEAEITTAEPILRRWGIRSWQIYNAP